MGLSLEFYSGDRDAIAEAVREVDFDRFDDAAVVTRRADLSLHISPRDLDLLSQACAKTSGREAMNLSANLSGLIDEEDRGALVVDPTWVAYIAAVPDGTSAVIAEYWAEAMRTEYQDPEIHVNDDLLRRVSDLIELCKTAHQSGENVTHVWYL